VFNSQAMLFITKTVFFKLYSADLTHFLMKYLCSIVRVHYIFFAGRGLGQVQRPTGIAVLSSGDFVVSDYDNKVIHYFSSNGKYKKRIGAGKLMGPRGVFSWN